MKKDAIALLSKKKLKKKKMTQLKCTTLSMNTKEKIFLPHSFFYLWCVFSNGTFLESDKFCSCVPTLPPISYPSCQLWTRSLLILEEGEGKEFTVSRGPQKTVDLCFKGTCSLAIYEATTLCRSNTLIPFSAHHFSACSSVKCLRLLKTIEFSVQEIQLP